MEKHYPSDAPACAASGSFIGTIINNLYNGKIPVKRVPSAC